MFDLVIIGSGSAAFAAALKAAEHDSKIAMVEKGTIGGTCVNVAASPARTFFARESFDTTILTETSQGLDRDEQL